MPHLTRLFALILLLVVCQSPPARTQGTGKQVSLKNYAPPPGNAGHVTAGESFSWATAYYATAITFRLGREELFSPYYLFDALPKVKGGCRLPENYISQAQQILKDGYFRDSDYKRTGNCSVKPDLGKYKNIDRYRINLSIVLKARQHVHPGASEVWFSVRRRLDAGTPVIATLVADEAFRNLKTGTWQPVKGGKTFMHTVVITGYDEARKEVEILSPFGRSWGKQGFGRISFDQLGAFSELYALSRPDNHVIKNKVSKAALRNPISGNLRLRSFIAENTNMNPVFDNLDYVWRNDILEARDRKPFPVGMQFQVVVDGIVPGSFFYAFSIGPDGKAIIHRPQSQALGNIKTNPFSARIAASEKQIVLPRPTPFGSRLIHRGFHKNQTGTDLLIVLHCLHEINDGDLLDLVKALKYGQNAAFVTTQLKEMFGAKLVGKSSISSTSGTLHYAAAGGGDILPLIIRIF